MRGIALSLMLLFTTFTVVLSTYYMWQKGKSTPIVLVEEEEDHAAKSCSAQDFLVTDFHPDLSLVFELLETTQLSAHVDRDYEDVFLIAPFSPPDAA